MPMREQHDHHDASDRALWKACKAAMSPQNPGQPTKVDLQDLAAWLDGAATDDVRVRIESALANPNNNVDDDEMLALNELVSLRDALSASGSLSPADQLDPLTLTRIVNRAAALVPEAAATNNRTTAVAFPQHRPMVFTLPWLRRGFAAAASVLICVLGWQTGQSATSVDVAGLTSGMTEDMLATEMSFGLFASGDEVNLFAFDLQALNGREARP